MKVERYLVTKLIFKFKTLLTPLWVTRWGRVAWICGLVDQIIIVIVSSTIFFGPKKTHFKSRKGKKTHNDNLFKVRFCWDFAKIANILKSLLSLCLWDSILIGSFLVGKYLIMPNHVQEISQPEPGNDNTDLFEKLYFFTVWCL